jgi:hypothetical protein
MTDDLVKRLLSRHANEYQTADLDALEAAYRIEELEARLKQTEDRVKQYEYWVLQIRRWIKTGEVPR